MTFTPLVGSGGRKEKNLGAAISSAMYGALCSATYIFLFFCSLSLFAARAHAIPEICGNGIDDDGVGGDQACPEPDKDNDGYGTGADCDDNDYKIFPGVVTASGCPAGQTHLCQLNGTYTACSATPVCEATGTGVCKYIDCTNGSDSGNGSFSSPWKSPKMVGGFTDSSLRPAGWYQVNAGDVVYFKGSGVCSTIYSPGASTPNVMLYINRSGVPGSPIVFKRYPGSTVVFDPPFASGSPGHVVFAEGPSNIKLEDLEITGSYAAVMYLTDTSNVEITRVKCHDTQGTTNDNVACVNAAMPINHYIHHNEFYNVWDPAQPGADNVTLIAYFKGGLNRFEYNRLYYSNDPAYGGPIHGRCFKYKHPATVPGPITIKGNQFWNCEKSAVISSTASIRMDHNLVVNTGPKAGGGCGFFCGEVGGGVWCSDELVENNTFVNTQGLCMADAGGASLGAVTFRNNVVQDNATSYTSENGFFRIERYSSDSIYNQYQAIGVVRASNNCYFNSNNVPLVFDYFGDPNAGGAGGMYSFAQWQAAGFDSGSVYENPGFNAMQNATSPTCSNLGWLVNRSAGNARPNPPTGLSATIVP